jgi:hypothetical protein
MPVKEEVVQFMTNVINDLNRQMAEQNQIPESEVQEAIEQHQQQLMFVNSILYDALEANNLIVSD